MTIQSILTLAALAASTLAIPPPEFGFPDSGNHTELSVAFTFNGNTTVVKEGQLFGSNITSQRPALALDPALYQSVADYTGQYLIVMVDPDASTPGNPTSRFILHWMAPNVTQNTAATSPQAGRALTNSTPAHVPFRAPTPGTTSSAHRYIIYAFAQQDSFTIPAAYTGYSDANRTSFNLTSFIKDAGLGQPAAAEYFYVSRQDAVPGTFIALPGGQYPGGNGEAVFAGSATTTSGATTTPTSGSSTSTSKAAAVPTAGPGLVGGLGSTVLIGLAVLL